MTEFKSILDTETGEVSQIPLSEAEIAEIAAFTLKLEEERTKAEQAKATAEAKLAALGLTAEDLKALGLG